MTRATPRPAPGTAAKLRRARANLKARIRRAVYRAVDLRDKGCCRACGEPSPWMEHHHIVKRSQLGPDSAENVVLLCGRCHADVHAARLRVTGTGDFGGLEVRRVARPGVRA